MRCVEVEPLVPTVKSDQTKPDIHHTISDLQSREPEKAFVALQPKASSSTSKKKQFSVTNTSFDDSKSFNDAITNLSSELPSIVDNGLIQGIPTELTGTSAVPATTFSRFSDLAPELRIKIWHHSFPLQNLILGEFSFMKPQSSTFQNIPPASFCPYDILPVAFVNRESRAKTLKHYLTLYQARCSYQNKTSSSDTQAEEPRSNEEYLIGATDLLLPHVMYFNPKIDYLTIVYPDFKVGSCEILAIFPLYNQEAARFLGSIREVKVYHVRLESSRLRFKINMRALFDMLMCFKSLQHVDMIFQPGETYQIDYTSRTNYLVKNMEKQWIESSNLDFAWGTEGDGGVYLEMR
ncbi:hypothetical protein ACHAO8_011015 [Botrytis cinerea]